MPSIYPEMYQLSGVLKMQREKNSSQEQRWNPIVNVDVRVFGANNSDSFSLIIQKKFTSNVEFFSI